MIRPKAFLLPFLFLPSTALAAGVRGNKANSPLPPAPSLSHSDCNNEILDMTISSLPDVPGTCQSFGFRYNGGKCANQGAECTDLKQGLHTSDDEPSYIVVSNVEDPSKVYHKGFYTVGCTLQFTSLPSSEDIMPEMYNFTLYSTDDDLSFDNLIQTVIVKAPCNPSIPVHPGPIQLIFNAMTPPSRRWRIEFSSSSVQSWTVEWIRLMSDQTVVPLPQESASLSLGGKESNASIDISVKGGLKEQEGSPVHFIAELTSTSGGQPQSCILDEVWDGSVSAS